LILREFSDIEFIILYILTDKDLNFIGLKMPPKGASINQYIIWERNVEDIKHTIRNTLVLAISVFGSYLIRYTGVVVIKDALFIFRD
jgi:hypothetical protein